VDLAIEKPDVPDVQRAHAGVAELKSPSDASEGTRVSSASSGRTGSVALVPRIVIWFIPAPAECHRPVDAGKS
jgi:hypothetical protein